jgi:hypothetical protein
MMQISDWLKQATDMGWSAFAQATKTIGAYQDILADSSKWEAAQLGPEDIRWLELMQTVASSEL